MKNHFTLEEKNNEILKVLGVVTSTLTLFLSFFLFYDFFFINKYWVNSWRLYRILKRNKNVKVEYVGKSNVFLSYVITIDSIVYVFYHNESGSTIDLSDDFNYGHSNYIGLFVASPIRKILNKRITSLVKSKIERKDYSFIKMEKLRTVNM